MERLFLTGGSGFIGSEIARRCLAAGYAVANFDIAPPKSDSEQSIWIPGNVRDLQSFGRAANSFSPTILIHLASDTDVRADRISEFTTTIEGTQNAIAVCKGIPGMRKFVHISTQFAVSPGVIPRDELHLEPYTTYGAAKAETERMVRAAAFAIPWIIIRPTIIWGPNHPTFRHNIFRYIGQRVYLHPASQARIMRTFGYVTNAAQQILSLALSTEGRTGGHLFYVGDDTIDYDRWVDAFALGLTGYPARRVPLWLLEILGKVGDVSKFFGLPAPVDSGHVFRMSTSSAIDLTKTLAVTGKPPVMFEEGVKQTLLWIQSTSS